MIASGEDRALALLLLLPAAHLLWPLAGAPLVNDPFPHLGGAGWAALAAVPAGLLLVICRRAGFALATAPLLLAIGAGVVSHLAGEATDAFEARRACVHACVALVMFTGGAALGEAGRAWFARGLVVLSIAATLGAFLRPASALAGVLGNTGALSQAALPGAVAGAWLLAAGAGPWRVAGLAAIALFAAHAARAPVLAGILAAGGALVLGALAAPRLRLRPRARPILLGCAALLPLALLGLRGAATEPQGITAQVAADTGGVAVRLGVWTRVPALLADQPLLGVGPGQLRARFPSYRDQGEIRASAHGSCEDHATEIGHLHSDWLQGVAELGLIGGAGWIAFLLIACWAALAALRQDQAERALLGAAALGLLANSLVHTPLLYQPASSVLGFALLGAISPRAANGARGGPLVALLLVPTLVGAWAGWPLVRHGRALSAHVRALAELAQLEGSQDARAIAVPLARAGLEIERALAAAPESAAALTRRAIWLGELGGKRDEERATWLAVLERRPHDLAALQRLALLALRAGDPDTARTFWERALALDPSHPRVLRNLAQLELDTSHPAEADLHLAALEDAGCLTDEWLRSIALRLLFEGRGAAAFAVLGRADERFVAPYGGLVDALSKEAAQRGDETLAAGLESAAHHLWAREHVAGGQVRTAVRSYRQALRPTHAKHKGGAPLLRFELAAAQLLALDRAGALKTLGSLPADHPARSRLPAWAREALEAAGL